MPPPTPYSVAGRAGGPRESSRSWGNHLWSLSGYFQASGPREGSWLLSPSSLPPGFLVVVWICFGAWQESQGDQASAPCTRRSHCRF